MNPINPQLLNDFVVFGRELIRSQDIDPLYPVLQWLEKDMEPEQALWFTFLYLTYYNLASGTRAFELLETPQEFPAQFERLRIATERRNLNGNKVRPHVDDYVGRCRTAGSQTAFLQQGWGDDPVANYEAFWVTAQQVYQNGRWAAFKWAEILKKVHGWNLAAPDMRMEFCSGPKAGLNLLYGLEGRWDSNVEVLNYYSKDLRQQSAREGLIVPDWETLETVLCNFHSLREGRYYIGHDIDELQETIDHSSLNPHTKAWLYAARAKVLPHEYLGEIQNWFGVDKSANRIYRDAGIVYARGGTVNLV